LKSELFVFVDKHVNLIAGENVYLTSRLLAPGQRKSSKVFFGF